jgi:hypothetical protein
VHISHVPCVVCVYVPSFPFMFINLIVVGDEQKLWIFSLYNFSHFPVISSLSFQILSLTICIQSQYIFPPYERLILIYMFNCD